MLQKYKECMLIYIEHLFAKFIRKPFPMDITTSLLYIYGWNHPQTLPLDPTKPNLSAL